MGGLLLRMGLADELGYHHRTPNWFQRAMQAFGSTKFGAWVFSHLLRHLDDAVEKVSGNKSTAPDLLAGLPVLDLTTTGRKSGQPRTSHLIAIPYGADLALLGTNFGQPNTPAWVLNLEADPAATVHFKGTSVAVRATPASVEQQEQVFATADRIYRGYRKYQTRIDNRRIRVFVITAAK